MFQKGHRGNQEILAMVHNGNIPSTWRVFHISRIKLIALILGFCSIIGLLMGFLAIYFLVNFDHHPPVPSSALYTISVVILMFITGTVILSFFIWTSMKNIILVLTPEEFVRGDSQKPKKILHIHYQEVVEMYATGNIVMIAMKRDNLGAQQIDCRLFEPSTREVASSLITAYENFKAKPASGNKRTTK